MTGVLIVPFRKGGIGELVLLKVLKPKMIAVRVVTVPFRGLKGCQSEKKKTETITNDLLLIFFLL